MKLLISLGCLFLAGSSALADVLIYHGTYTKKIGGPAAENEPKSGGAYLVYDTSNSAYRFVTYYHHRAWRQKRHELSAAGSNGTFLKRTQLPARGERFLNVFSNTYATELLGTYLQYMLKLEGLGGIASTDVVGEGFPKTLKGVETRIQGGSLGSDPMYYDQRYTLQFQREASVQASADGQTFEMAVQKIRESLTARGFTAGMD